jgi:hypothetical protein
MRRGLVLFALILALPGYCLMPQAANAQSNIVTKYDEPTDPQYRGIYDSLVRQHVLERLERFLAPLRLPNQLTIRMAQCEQNAAYRPYQPGGEVTICYQFVKKVEDAAVKPGSAGALGVVAVPREAIIIGPIVEEVLHDVALAVFDKLQIPVWGRPEDAADHVAALIMLQFGPEVARTTILGTAWFLFWAEQNPDYSSRYFNDVRPPLRQRYYNILCIAYGADPVTFSMLRPLNRSELPTDLPALTAAACGYRYAAAGHPNEFEGQYEKLAAAFKTLILDPYVDPVLLKQVLATNPLKYP